MIRYYLWRYIHLEILNQPIKTNSELRADARNQLKGKWGTAILLCFIYSILSSIVGFIVPYIGSVLNLLITGPLSLGLAISFMNLVRNGSFKIEDLFDGFKSFASALITQLLVGIFTFLWSLLLIIPGIIAAYRYSMVFYILNDNPGISATDAINASKAMMAGYKWKLFCLHLSFIGWGILSILTLGIGLLWLIPYINAATANFYQNLVEAAGDNTVTE
jgi:uncharacterized membrane protein